MQTDPTKPRSLSAAELREGLALVQAELSQLGPHPADPARWGQLAAHLEGLQDPARAPYALTVLRRRAAAEQAGGMVVLDLGSQDVR